MSIDYMIKIIQSLEHKNIQKIIELYDEDDSYFLVSKLYEKNDLCEVILNRETFSEIEASRIIT